MPPGAPVPAPKDGRRKPTGKPGKPGKSGQRQCSICQKWMDQSMFPAGKAMCGADWRAYRNVEACARSQEQQAWWDEVRHSPKKLKETITAYHVRCSPEITGLSRNKRNGFHIAQFREEVRRAEQMLFDGVYEMLNLVAFQKFKALPENGGFDAQEATTMFQAMLNDPTSITDLLGPSPKLARRVAVKVKDVITMRDLQERSRSLLLADKEQRQPSGEQLEKMHDRLAKDAAWTSAAALGRWEEAKNLSKARINLNSEGETPP